MSDPNERRSSELDDPKLDDQDRTSEHPDPKRTDGPVVSGFVAANGDAAPQSPPARHSRSRSPRALPPEEARREGTQDYGNPFLDPAGMAYEVDGDRSADRQDRPPSDDGYIEHPAGRDPIEGGATDLDDQIRSEHA